MSEKAKQNKVVNKAIEGVSYIALAALFLTVADIAEGATGVHQFNADTFDWEMDTGRILTVTGSSLTTAYAGVTFIRAMKNAKN